MKISMYQVDAFAGEIFKGNPAAICILENWIDEKLMQNIAMENNLSETAFCIVKEDICELRWFTPEEEIDLCGHATLATAFVIFEILNYPSNKIKFSTQSGILDIEKYEEDIIMEFPHCTLVPYWSKILGKKKLVTQQLSQRSGILKCEALGDKVKISGKAKLFFKGEIYLD